MDGLLYVPSVGGPDPIRRPTPNHSTASTARVALQALPGGKTVADIAKQYDVHPSQVTTWKNEMLQPAGELFGSTAAMDGVDAEKVPELHAEIGELTVRRDLFSIVLGRFPAASGRER